MASISLRELNQHTAEVVARVERGERLDITRNGRKIATIEPLELHPLYQLMASHEVVLASSGVLDLPDGVANASGNLGLGSILDDRYGFDRP